MRRSGFSVTAPGVVILRGCEVTHGTASLVETRNRIGWFTRNEDTVPITLRLRAILTLVALAALMDIATPAVAQRVQLVPNIGVYVPTTNLLQAVQGEEYEQQVSLTVGGQLDFWFGNRIGVQGTGSYAPSSLSVSANGTSAVEDANIFTGTGRLLVYLIPDSSPVSFLVTGGVALINRGGSAYEGAVDRTDVGGALGASVGFRLGPVVNLRVTADSYLYNAGVLTQVPGATPEDTMLQRDVQLSFGFGIPLLGIGG